MDTNDMHCVMGQDVDTNEAWIVSSHGETIFTLDDAHKLAAEKMNVPWYTPGLSYKVFKLVPWTGAK